MFDTDRAAIDDPTVRPIHNGLDWIFSIAKSKGIAGGDVGIADEAASMLRIETTTLLFADIVESVRLIEADEARNVARIRAITEQLAKNVAPQFKGMVLERRGDGLLLKFPTARGAIRFAHAVHGVAAEASAGRSAQDTIAFRVGVHRTPVYSDDQAVFGVGVSHASRIASLAAPGQTLLSVEARDELSDGVDAEFRDLGNFYAKHVSASFRLFDAIPMTPSQARGHMLPKADTRALVALAVLPLDEISLTSNPASVPARCFGDVFADLATQAFSRSATIRVISRLSARAAGQGPRDGRSLSLALGVDYVVSGTWRLVAEDIYLVSLELMCCVDSTVIWTDERRVSAQELLQERSDYLTSIVSGVVDHLAAVEIARTRTSPLPTIASHSLVLSSIGLMHRLSRDDFEAARPVIEAVVERLPRHPVPRAWLARWHTFRVVQGWGASDRSDHEQAIRHSETAVELDPEISLVHAIAGSVCMSVRRDIEGALRCYDTALKINGNDALAWTLKAAAHALDDHGEPAFAAAMRAIELSPLDPMRFLHESLAASACLSLGDYESAYAWATRSFRANRAHHSTIRVAAIAASLLGREAEGRMFVAELRRALPSYTVASFLGAAPHAQASKTRLLFADALRSAGLPAS